MRRLRFRRPRPKLIDVDNPDGDLRGSPVELRLAGKNDFFLSFITPLPPKKVKKKTFQISSKLYDLVIIVVMNIKNAQLVLVLTTTHPPTFYKALG